jgi:hypothetical protein
MVEPVRRGGSSDVQQPPCAVLQDAIVGSASGLPDACDRAHNLNVELAFGLSSCLGKGEI